MYAFSSCVGKGSRGLPHAHEFHEFFFCLTPRARDAGVDSDCVHLVADQTVATHSGDLFLLPAGQPHLCITEHSSGCPCLVFYCSADEFSAAVSGDAEAGAIFAALVEYARPGKNSLPLKPENRERICAILQDFTEECARKAPGWRCAMKELLLRLLLDIYRGWDGTTERLNARLEKAEPTDRMRDVLHYINAQYMYPLEVEDMLKICCLSRSHFHALFRREVGQTFKDYLNTVRVGYAKTVLTETEMPIAEIALSCGFSSQSRFNHVFRQITGCSPGQARRVRY